MLDLTTQPEIFSPAQAYWNQRFELRALRDRILKLSDAIDYKGDLSPNQWAQLMAVVLEFKPDIILELGRHHGNSTCAFTEAANHLNKEGPACRVVSICLSDYWEKITQWRILRETGEEWFRPLTVIRGDILTFDFGSVLKGAERCLVFWDAHGYDVAECVLGRILPQIAGTPNMVIMHDLSDARYIPAESSEYGDNGIWKGNDWSGPRVRLGNINSAVEQAVSIVDFVSRNNIVFDSADHALNMEIGKDPARHKEMLDVLGNDLFSLGAHWFWFTLNERKGPLTFPHYQADVSRNYYETNIFEHVRILDVSLRDAVLSEPRLSQIIRRVNNYLKMGKINLALRIAEKELGNFRESSEILSGIRRLDGDTLPDSKERCEND
ncbi:MAG: hypothetical protein HZB61_10575 [Nitrospirae bacterium]|nr:hypothetical protein [Nitrospirota bacterium]